MTVIRDRELKKKLRRQRVKGRGRRAVRSWFSVALKAALAGIAAVGIAFAAAVVWFDLGPRAASAVNDISAFVISDLSVVTDGVLTARDVLRTAGLKKGMKVWREDLTAAVARLEKHPKIKKVLLKKERRGTLTVKIEERKPAALLFCGGGYFVCDSTGLAFERVSDVGAYDLMIVSIKNCDSTRPSAVSSVVEEGIKLASLLVDSGVFKGGDISELNYDPVLGWSVFLSSFPHVVHWGGASAGNKVWRLRAVLSDLKRRKIGDVLFLDIDYRDRAFVRLPLKAAVEAAEPQRASARERG